MALEEYKRKRDFGITPEPAGATPHAKTPAEPLAFVIQKHAARRLHYDFRLELGGVMKSWAVPKGPSLDPAEKRLAVHTEDHPMEYNGFEGVIPKGQYGGGTVMLWDRGTWIPEGPNPEEAYRKGTLKFTLDGEKLHGRWALVRMGGRASREAHQNWLLIKERDETAVPGSDAAIVEDNPLSVDTGRSMDAIAADRDRVWDSHHGEITPEPETARPSPAKPAREKRKAAPARIAGAHKAKMPAEITPQMATLAKTAPDGDEWLYEIKYDGYRLIARIENGAARLLTRNGLDWTAKFPALAQVMAELPVDTAIIDGEVVALMPDGTTHFSELQDRIATGRTADLVFYAFDLLYRDGYDLTGVALEQRKAALADLVGASAEGMIRYSDHQIGRGGEFFQQACKYALEGVLAKRRDRPYRPGRGTEWLKIKCANLDEFVVIGFTDPAGTRFGFGALILGYYDPGGELHYAGRVGTGFNDKQLTAFRERLDEIERKTAAAKLPKGVSKKGVHWTEPVLVAEIRYAGWTGDSMVRQGSFQGLREDKSPREVVYDPANLAGSDPPPPAAEAAEAAPLPAAAGRAKKTAKSNKPLSRTAGEGGSSRAPARGETAEGSAPELKPARDGSIEFGGLRLTHPERVLYPEQGITKLALAQYYDAVKDWALPELANRPLSLVRCPEGHGKECFYQKHATTAVPKVVGRVEIPEGAGTGTGTYTYIKDAAGLIAMVQMGVLEIHPWGSTVDKLETPDRITFDFDPDVGLPWERVTEAAIDIREALAGIGLRSFPKTTGGKGLHVVVPIAPKLDWEAVKQFAHWVANKFVEAYPERFTSNMAKRARAGRIFIDYLRNGRGATAIGAYSARARPGAPVATPISWEEVEGGVKPDAFTVLTVPDRLAKHNADPRADPWAEMRKLRQSISAAVRRQAGI